MIQRDRSRLNDLLMFSSAVQNREALLDDIAETGAMLEGHFGLASNQRHARQFLRFRRLATRPEALSRAAKELARLAGLLPRPRLVFVAPESAGSLLADQLAFELQGRLLLSPIDLERRPMSELRGELDPGDSVVIVNDVSVSGYGLDRLLEACRQRGVSPIAAVLYAIHSRFDFDRWVNKNGIRGAFLARLSFEEYEAKECRLCAQDVEIIAASELN